ncbi:MAG: hypothetical protein ACRD28_10890 [Acidobacteriaceae bacterium]
MRFFSMSLAVGAVLIFGVTCSARAQDQPAAGSPPPGASAQAPAQTQPTPTQQTPDQNAAPAGDYAWPPPIDNVGRPNPKRRARMLARKLGLTSVQEAQIEPILMDHQQRMRRARTDQTLTPQDRKARVREINHDSVRRINALLTPEQRQQYRQLRQEQRARRMEQRERTEQPEAQQPQ